MNDELASVQDAFSVQAEVRGPWRRYLDLLAPARPALYQHCLRLTGSIWDAEDLAQDALLRVFTLLGKLDADMAAPEAYLKRTASNLWVDQIRRRVKEQAVLRLDVLEDAEDDSTLADGVDAETAATHLLRQLAPQERAAVVLKDVLDYSLRDTAAILDTTVGAVKSALSRGRARLDALSDEPSANQPDRAVVQAFMQALTDTDIDVLKALCVSDLTVDMVGGAEMQSFEESQTFFAHAHFVMPEIGFGENPHWKLVEYASETLVVGFRTLDGVEGVNEVHRLTVIDGLIHRDRCYCFSPDVLKAFAQEIGEPALSRPYRSPSP